jgi:hypothetical protein
MLWSMSPFASFDAGPQPRGVVARARRAAATLSIAVTTLELLADRAWHRDYGRRLADALGPGLVFLAVDGGVGATWSALEARGLVARRERHALRITPLGSAALGAWRARYAIAVLSLGGVALAAGLAIRTTTRGRSVPRSSPSDPTR